MARLENGSDTCDFVPAHIKQCGKVYNFQGKSALKGALHNHSYVTI